MSGPRLEKEVTWKVKAGKESSLSDGIWPRHFLLICYPSPTPVSPLAGTKRVPESAGQMVGKMPLLWMGRAMATDKGGQPQETLVDSTHGRALGEEYQERTGSNLRKETQMNFSYENKAKEI